MLKANLSVREIEERDIEPITNYWLTADQSFLQGLGVDVAKIPSREEWISMLKQQLVTPVEQKQSFCMIWEVDGQAIGHSNINKIIFGEEAYMHIHIWYPEYRKHGLGASLMRMTIPHFFEKYHLKRLYCEPYALNPAPNKTLEKLGFKFCKTHITIPGWLNFEQQVNLWRTDNPGDL